MGLKAHWFTTKRFHRVLTHACCLAGRQVLDAGCGFGDNAIYLAQKGYRCVGFDFSAKAIEVAKDRAEKAGVSHLCEFCVGDALNVGDNPPLRRAKFDTILDSACLQCFDPKLQVRRQCVTAYEIVKMPKPCLPDLLAILLRSSWRGCTDAAGLACQLPFSLT